MTPARSSVVVDGNESANSPFRRSTASGGSYKAATFMDMPLDRDGALTFDLLVGSGERTQVDGGNRLAKRP